MGIPPSDAKIAKDAYDPIFQVPEASTTIDSPPPTPIEISAHPVIDTSALVDILSAAAKVIEKQSRKNLVPPRKGPPITVVGAATPAGRNNLCGCGSGKKYKKCCIRVTV